MKKSIILILCILILLNDIHVYAFEEIDWLYDTTQYGDMPEFETMSFSAMKGLVVKKFPEIDLTKYNYTIQTMGNDSYCAADMFLFQKDTVSVVKPRSMISSDGNIYYSHRLVTYYLDDEQNLKEVNNQSMYIRYYWQFSNDPYIEIFKANEYKNIYITDEYIEYFQLEQYCNQPIAPDEEHAQLYLLTGDVTYLSNADIFVDVPAPFNIKAYYQEDKLYISYNNVDYAAAVEPSTSAYLRYYSSEGEVLISKTYSLDYVLSGAFTVDLKPLEGYEDGCFTVDLYNKNKINDVYFESDWVQLRYTVGSDVYYIGDNEYTIHPYEEPTNVDDNILDAIINLPKNIWSFISEGFTNIVDAVISIPEKIVEGLKELFVPSNEDFASLKDDWEGLLANRFGAVYQSVDYIVDFVSGFQEQTESKSVTMPAVTVPLSGSEFSFGGYDVQLIPDGFESIVSILKGLISLVCTLAFLNTMKRKFEGLLGGGHE